MKSFENEKNSLNGTAKTTERISTREWAEKNDYSPNKLFCKVSRKTFKGVVEGLHTDMLTFELCAAVS